MWPGGGGTYACHDAAAEAGAAVEPVIVLELVDFDALSIVGRRRQSHTRRRRRGSSVRAGLKTVRSEARGCDGVRGGRQRAGRGLRDVEERGVERAALAMTGHLAVCWRLGQRTRRRRRQRSERRQGDREPARVTAGAGSRGSAGGWQAVIAAMSRSGVGRGVGWVQEVRANSDKRAPESVLLRKAWTAAGHAEPQYHRRPLMVQYVGCAGGRRGRVVSTAMRLPGTRDLERRSRSAPESSEAPREATCRPDAMPSWRTSATLNTISLVHQEKPEISNNGLSAIVGDMFPPFLYSSCSHVCFAINRVEEENKAYGT